MILVIEIKTWTEKYYGSEADGISKFACKCDHKCDQEGGNLSLVKATISYFQLVIMLYSRCNFV